MAAESIYALIPPEQKKVVRPPMYRSMYPHDTAPTASTFGAAATASIPVTNVGGDYQAPATAHASKLATATFGPAGRTIATHNPMNYTRKHSKEVRLPSPSKFTYHDETDRKPAIPSRKEKPITGLTTTKNFVLANAVENILAEPKKRESASASQVDWLHKEDFGRVPAYLTQIKQQIDLEYDMVRTAHQQMVQQTQQGMRLLSEEERLELLGALKQKWESVNKVYQTMTHQVVLDTIGKVRRKEQCESELQQLEKDIKRLEKKQVYVVDE